MKIKDMIAKLETWEELYGNIEVVMSTDPEGNSYSTIDNRWSFAAVRDGEDDFIARMIAERKLNSMTKEEKEFNNKAKIIGLCLIPFEEGYDSAEEAVKHIDK